MNSAIARLRERIRGQVVTPVSADRGAYDAARIGANLAIEARPALVVIARSSSDVVEAVRFAGEHQLSVGLQATGFGACNPVDGGLLINTAHLRAVTVDRHRMTATMSAGTTGAQLISAIGTDGTAAVVGDPPTAGFISHAAAGGINPWSRAWGCAADAICELEVVTADGRIRRVDATHHPDLFWALRGGGADGVAVVAMKVALLAPRARNGGRFSGGIFNGGGLNGDTLTRGSLRFGEEQFDEAMGALGAVMATAPRELSTSVVFGRPPLAAAHPARDRLVAQVRVAYSGSPADASSLIAPLRAVGPSLDTVAPVLITTLGRAGITPIPPRRMVTDSTALGGILPPMSASARTPGFADIYRAVAGHLIPDAPATVEIRQLGGALAERPDEHDSVGHRDAGFLWFGSVYPDADEDDGRTYLARLRGALAGYDRGGPLRSMLPTGRRATGCFESDTLARLVEVRRVYDPDQMFAYGAQLVDPVPRLIDRRVAHRCPIKISGWPSRQP